jgi:low affinity Fe/Cu permease
MSTGRSSSGRISAGLESLSEHITRWTGGSAAFALAALVIVVWAVLGPVFHFSDTWQLVVNTGTTIVTFLMVFLIQRAQNKDALAIQLKLNEIVAALEGASNRLIAAENLSEQELASLRRHYKELGSLAAKDAKLTESHSVEEARLRHRAKHRARGSRRAS